MVERTSEVVDPAVGDDFDGCDVPPVVGDVSSNLVVTEYGSILFVSRVMVRLFSTSASCMERACLSG